MWLFVSYLHFCTAPFISYAALAGERAYRYQARLHLLCHDFDISGVRVIRGDHEAPRACQPRAVNPHPNRWGQARELLSFVHLHEGHVVPTRVHLYMDIVWVADHILCAHPTVVLDLDEPVLHISGDCRPWLGDPLLAAWFGFVVPRNS